MENAPEVGATIEIAAEPETAPQHAEGHVLVRVINVSDDEVISIADEESDEDAISELGSDELINSVDEDDEDWTPHSDTEDDQVSIPDNDDEDTEEDVSNLVVPSPPPRAPNPVPPSDEEMEVDIPPDLPLGSVQNLDSANQVAMATPSGSEDISDPNTRSSNINTSMQEFKTPKKVKPQEIKEKSPLKSDDDDAECCPICFESWTNSGSHRLVSLKCGHLFGQSCIEKWLKGQGGKCPHCNAKATKKDIRVIYAKSLKAVDSSERDRALEELDKERKSRQKFELEAAQSRLRYQMALEECNRMRQELERQRQQLDHARNLPATSTMGSPSPHASQPSVGLSQMSGKSFIFDRAIKIWEAGGCRVLAFSDHLGALVVSQPSASPLFPGFGVKKINSLDFKTSQYVAVHNKMIRDLGFNPTSADGLLLSCAIDKNIKMTSLVSNTVVQTYQCDMPLWSCTWNTDDRNYFFAGQQNGTVRMFDMRNTAEHVQQINVEGSRSPVVSLQYVAKKPDATFRPGGVLVGQLDRSTFFEAKTGQEFLPHPLPLEGNLTCLSVEPHTRHVLASYRPTARHPSVRHQMCALSNTVINPGSASTDQMCTCQNIHTFHGGRTQKLLARSCIVVPPGNNNQVLVCAGDEASQSLHIWDSSSGLQKQRIPTQAPVVDICPLQVNDQTYLAALTEKTVRLHKWS